ncbi:MAG: acyl-CoA thioesterase [Planctomycetota bacterium]|jgi:acyl-CoA thioester hydrolase
MRVEPRSADYEDTPSIEFPDCTSIDEHTIQIVPRYSETDQAGVVHHTVYPVWFEMGRTELLRVNGLAYSQLEKAGVFFVVADLTAKYRRPCFYDETLDLTTVCSKITAARVEHTYTLKRAETGVVLAEGTSILACVDRNGKPQRMPEFMYPEQ